MVFVVGSHQFYCIKSTSVATFQPFFPNKMTVFLAENPAKKGLRVLIREVTAKNMRVFLACLRVLIWGVYLQNSISVNGIASKP